MDARQDLRAGRGGAPRDVPAAARARAPGAHRPRARGARGRRAAALRRLARRLRARPLPPRRARASPSSCGRAPRPALRAAAPARPARARPRRRCPTRSTRLRARIPTSASGSQTGAAVDVPRALEPLAQSVLAEAVRNARKHAEPRASTYARAAATALGPRDRERRRARALARTPGMGLRLAALEALQAGGLVEFGEREPGTWRVRLAVPLSGLTSTRAGMARASERKLRVLVVDDHEVVHWGLRLMLGELPWVERCLSARNGDEALALHARTPARGAGRPVRRRGVGRGDLRAAARRVAHDQRTAHLGRRADLPERRARGGAAASSRRTGPPPTSPARCGWSGSA